MRSAAAVLVFMLLSPQCLADAFDDLRNRWLATLTGGGALDMSIPEVASAVAAINTTAKSEYASMQKTATRTTLWTDLASTTSSAAITSTYGRLHDLALAWATPGQSMYESSALLTDLLSALDWMNANRYNSSLKEYDNWYDWEIGSPVDLVDICILLYGQLSADQLSRYMAAVQRFDADPAILEVDTVKAVSTGGNRTDKCKVALLRGVLVKDASRIALAVSDLSPVFLWVTSGDGFYIDGSFIQHTRHPYTGSYGLVLLDDLASMFYLVHGSQWDVADPNAANLMTWIRQSYAPAIFEGAMMDMVRGRAISRSGSPDHAVGHSAIGSLLRVTQFAAADDAAWLEGTIKRWLIDDTTRSYASHVAIDLIGVAYQMLQDPNVAPADLPTSSHVYGSMDRALHLRPTWAVAISMHSTRIFNFESINGENLHGWHTGDGMVYLYTSDLLQFASDFWPTVDPQRLPGTTVIAGSMARQSQLGGSSAVGGASVDGYSAVMMQLNPDGRQLQAKKSWFLFDNELVALGADINSSAAGQHVETIVENRRLPAGAVFTADPNGAWANVASIGYYFPDGSPWMQLSQNHNGAWHDINTGGSAAVLTDLYQTLWFDHGIQPAGATYSYVLLPGLGPDDTAAYAAAPTIQVVENDATAQAVVETALGISAVNFWAPAQGVAGISSDAVAAVVVNQANGQIDIAAADPTQLNNGTLHLEIAVTASAVISQDPGVSVDQMSPTIKLSINVRGAHGKSLGATLAQ